jgi:ABC-type glutathione transport system ATPase component
LLALHDFGIRYGAFAALDGLSLSIQPGDRVGLAGASGSGKTSLLRCLAGLSDAQTTGEIQCRARVGYMPQEPLASLSPYLSVIDQVRDCGADNPAVLLGSLGLDQPRQHVAYPHQLSGGERQRVLLAQVLALRPELLALDEPAANLTKSRSSKPCAAASCA